VKRSQLRREAGEERSTEEKSQKTREGMEREEKRREGDFHTRNK
jgi:hypothetical protein